MARLELSTTESAEITSHIGSPDALFELGLMYSTGKELDPDLVIAHKWFNLAALKGNEAAKDYRMELSREMSKVEVAEAQKLAREWLKNN